MHQLYPDECVYRYRVKYIATKNMTKEPQNEESAGIDTRLRKNASMKDR